MTNSSQFRPGPPPDLKSELWARDYNEVKALGRKTNSSRAPAHTDIARFWEASGVSIYHGLVRSVADVPGRDATQNARLFMAVTQSADDAIIAVFDAKYHYNFWRPITAIRNGDIDGNDATERCVMDTIRQHADASGIPVCTLHIFGSGRNGPPGRDRKRNNARLLYNEPDGKQREADVDEDRRLYAGGIEWANL